MLLHPSDPEVKAYTLEELGGEIHEQHSLSVAISTLSEWHSWYGLNLRMDHADQRARQAKEKYAKENPSAAIQELEDYAQFVFTSETLEDRDVVNFSRLKKLRQKDRDLKQKDTVISQNERRIYLLEDSAATTKAKLLALTSAAKTQGGLTPETLKQIEEAAGLL